MDLRKFILPNLSTLLFLLQSCSVQLWQPLATCRHRALGTWIVAHVGMILRVREHSLIHAFPWCASWGSDLYLLPTVITIAILPVMVQICICEVCFFYLSSHKLLFHYISSANGHRSLTCLNIVILSLLQFLIYQTERSYFQDYQLNLTLQTFLTF